MFTMYSSLSNILTQNYYISLLTNSGSDYESGSRNPLTLGKIKFSSTHHSAPSRLLARG